MLCKPRRQGALNGWTLLSRLYRSVKRDSPMMVACRGLSMSVAGRSPAVLHARRPIWTVTQNLRLPINNVPSSPVYWMHQQPPSHAFLIPSSRNWMIPCWLHQTRSLGLRQRSQSVLGLQVGFGAASTVAPMLAILTKASLTGTGVATKAKTEERVTEAFMVMDMQAKCR